MVVSISGYGISLGIAPYAACHNRINRKYDANNAYLYTQIKNVTW